MKKIFLFLFLAPTLLFSQEKVFEKVPKQYSFEMGYRYVYSSNFENKAPMGYTMLFDYAWQLSGFTENKKKIFLSVPLGYTYLMGQDTMKDMRILSYGWTVCHELTKNKKITPFLGYALLLNSLSINGTKGSVFGHQTRFDFGCNFNINKRIKPFTKIEYSFTRYAFLGNSKSKMLQAVEIKAGIRF